MSDDSPIDDANEDSQIGDASDDANPYAAIADPTPDVSRRPPAQARGDARKVSFVSAWLLFIALSIGGTVLASLVIVLILVPIAYWFGVWPRTMESLTKAVAWALVMVVSYFAYRLSVTWAILPNLTKRNADFGLKHDENKVGDFLSKLE